MNECVKPLCELLKAEVAEWKDAASKAAVLREQLTECRNEAASLRTEVERLIAQVGRVLTQSEEHKSRLAAARAEVEQLQRDNAALSESASTAEAESVNKGRRLAAATKLLKEPRWRLWHAGAWLDWEERVRAFLANSLAAPNCTDHERAVSTVGHETSADIVEYIARRESKPLANAPVAPTRTDRECDCETADEHERAACLKSCTSHERAILDAWASVPTSTLHAWANHPSLANESESFDLFHSISKASRAELSRRESKS